MSNYPVLPLDADVVLPGMVVPVELEAPGVRAAVDAAQLAGTPLLLVPRPEGRYASVGTLATVDQIGRLPGGQPAAVLRGTARATIGTGTTGPGTALWVTADEIAQDGPYADDVLALAREYKGLVTSILPSGGRRSSSTASPASPTRRCSPTPPATRRTWPSSRRSRSCSRPT